MANFLKKANFELQKKLLNQKPGESTMSTKILVISTSLRTNSNTDILADEFIRGKDRNFNGIFESASKALPQSAPPKEKSPFPGKGLWRFSP